MQYPNQPYAGPQMRPPTTNEFRPVQPTSWPVVIGTTSIVLGSLGLLCYGCNSLTTVAGPLGSGMMPPEVQAAQPQGAQLAYVIGSYCTNLALSVLLLISGIGLVRRRQWSRTVSIIWAWGKIVVSVVGAVVGFILAAEMADMINKQIQQQQAGTQQFSISPELVMLGMVFSLLFYLIWPVFNLIWFSRAKIKAEVATWN